MSVLLFLFMTTSRAQPRDRSSELRWQLLDHAMHALARRFVAFRRNAGERQDLRLLRGIVRERIEQPQHVRIATRRIADLAQRACRDRFGIPVVAPTARE